MTSQSSPVKRSPRSQSSTFGPNSRPLVETVVDVYHKPFITNCLDLMVIEIRTYARRIFAPFYGLKELVLSMKGSQLCGSPLPDFIALLAFYDPLQPKLYDSHDPNKSFC